MKDTYTKLTTMQQTMSTHNGTMEKIHMVGTAFKSGYSLVQWPTINTIIRYRIELTRLKNTIDEEEAEQEIPDTPVEPEVRLCEVIDKRKNKK